MNGPAPKRTNAPRPGLERRVEHRQVGAVVAVALLHAERLEGAVADRFGSGGRDPIPHGDRPLDWRRQFPAQLAGVADPGGVDRSRTDAGSRVNGASG